MSVKYDVFGEVNPSIRNDLENLYSELKKKKEFDEFFIQGIVIELNDMFQIDPMSVSMFVDYITAFASNGLCNFPISHKLKNTLLIRKKDILRVKQNPKLIKKDNIVESYFEIEEPGTPMSELSMNTSIGFV